MVGNRGEKGRLVKTDVCLHTQRKPHALYSLLYILFFLLDILLYLYISTVPPSYICYTYFILLLYQRTMIYIYMCMVRKVCDVKPPVDRSDSRLGVTFVQYHSVVTLLLFRDVLSNCYPSGSCLSFGKNRCSS